MKKGHDAVFPCGGGRYEITGNGTLDNTKQETMVPGSEWEEVMLENYKKILTCTDWTV